MDAEDRRLLRETLIGVAVGAVLGLVLALTSCSNQTVKYNSKHHPRPEVGR